VAEGQLDELLDPSSVTAKALRYIGRKFAQAFPWLAVGGVGAGLAASGLMAPIVASMGGVTSAIAALSGEAMAYAGATAVIGTPTLIQSIKSLFAADEDSIQAGIKKWVEKHVGDENDVAEFVLVHSKAAYLGQPGFRWRAKEWPVKLTRNQAEAHLEKNDKFWLDGEKAKQDVNTTTPNSGSGQTKPVDEAMGGGVDAKGRTQAQWVDLVMKQFPDARTSYERSGRRALAQLADGRRLIWKPITPDAFERPKPTMSEGAYNPYGYEVGQTVKLDNGQQGRVIDIFDDSIEVLLVGGRTVTVDFRDAQVIGEQGVAEATGDVKFDKMIKGITGKKEVAKQQKIDTKQQARDAFGGMFGGGNPVDKLSIRKKGMAEGRTK
jgi:hypothetical protein